MSLTNTAGFFKANQTTLPMINTGPESGQASINPRTKVTKFKDIVNTPGVVHHSHIVSANYLNTPVSDHDSFRNAIHHLGSDHNNNLMNQDIAKVMPPNTARGSSQQRKNRDLFKV